jgi:hypothetical protein
MFKKHRLRAKTGETYPPFLWIICISLGIIGAYNSRIGSVYHVTTDAILFASVWLIIIGLFVVFMSFNDGKANQDHEKVGIYSAINHPRLFGEYLILSGLIFQTINIIVVVLTIAILRFYNKWLIHRNLKTLFNYASYFRFNLFNMSDNKRGYYFSDSIKACIPYLFFSIVYLLVIIELRNRSIGRSLLDML